jgi:hypothetical protein
MLRLEQNWRCKNTLDILTAEEPWTKLESFHFYDRYVILVCNEWQLASFSPGDRVVFVGGGPLPLTLMLLNKFYGVKGISVEIVSELAKLSAGVLDRLGLVQKSRSFAEMRQLYHICITTE